LILHVQIQVYHPFLNTLVLHRQISTLLDSQGIIGVAKNWQEQERKEERLQKLHDHYMFGLTLWLMKG